MRSFNVMAAVAVVLIGTPAAAAPDKPAQPKARKVCRTYEEPGRITPKRICRVIPREEAAQDDRDASRGEAPKAGSN